MASVPRAKWLAAHAKKRDRIMRLRGQEKTMEQIAELVGVSRQRVQQVIAKETKGK